LQKKSWNGNVPDSLTGGKVLEKQLTIRNKNGRIFEPFFMTAVGIIIAVMVSGCGNPVPPTDDYLIKAGPVKVSSTQFARELDLKLTAYPYDIKSVPGEYNIMVLDLVATVSDEAVLLAGAKEKQIDVSSQELDQAETVFKKDYPEDSFEQMLLENAISYAVWKSRLKKDMVIEKLIQQDLVAVQEITPEDMVDFYNRQDRSKDPEKKEALNEAALVEQLRREKSQASYDQWMQALKNKYPLEIDKKAVAGFLLNRE